MSKKQKTGNVRPSDGADISAKVNTQPKVDEVADVTKVKAPSSTANTNAVEETEVPKQVFNTKRVASIAPSGSQSLGGQALMTLAAGGNAADNGISSDRTGVSTQVTGDRRNTRIGKKTNSTGRQLRTIVSEQVESAYQTSKPLAGNKDAVQGANGQPYNKHFHSQKTHGSLPGDFNFERSIDFISRDELLYVDGQYCKMQGVELHDSVPIQGDKLVAPGTTATEVITKGDYVHRDLLVTIDSNNDVTLDIITDNITPVIDDPIIAERAGKFAIMNANRAELDRQIMETKAGDENEESWSPLPLAVANPIALVHLFRTLEGSTGAELLTAIKKLDLATAFTINRTAKDGQTDTILNEVFNSVARKRDTQTDYVNLGWKEAADFRNGSSAWVIALNDTLNKYGFKSDLFTQPRAISLLMQVAQQNISPFKVRKDFVDLFHNREMFSTIGAVYDPYLPIMITDVEGLVHSYSFKQFITDDGKPRAVLYSWRDHRNTYEAAVYHPLIKGIYDYLAYNAVKIRRLFEHGDEDDPLVITIPMVHATTGYSAWSLLLAAASPEIVRARIAAFRDINSYADKNGYPFSDFISVSDGLSATFRNFDFISRDEPLKTRQMDSVHSISWTMPELFTEMAGIDKTEAGLTKPGDPQKCTLMPWYMAGEQYTETGAPEPDLHIMAMPNIRSGSTLGYLDALYAQSERDLRLSLDMMVSIPGYSSTNNKISGCFVYKLGLGSTGTPVVAYSTPLTLYDILSTPRELGLSQVAPANYLRVTQRYIDGTNVASRAAVTDNFDHSTSYIAYIYANSLQDAPGVNQPDPLLAGVGRGLSQVYYCLPAVRALNPHSLSHGFVMSLNHLIETMVTGYALQQHDAFSVISDTAMYNPIIRNNDDVPVSMNKINAISFMKAMWTRIQRLPFGISPWDTSAGQLIRYHDGDPVDANDRVSNGFVDPYEFLYYFGLAGFSASDYTEDVYNRLNKIQVEGMTFTEDLFILESLLTK